MSAFLTLLYTKSKPYLPAVYGVFLVLFIVVIAYYVYNNIYLPNIAKRKFKDVANASPVGGKINVYIFHVDWCPHCKVAMPEWTLFSDSYNKRQVNGFEIECIDVDCTTPTTDVQALMDTYGIKQYPTVFAIIPRTGTRPEVRVDYDAKVKQGNLEKFVISVANQQSGAY